MHNPVPARLRRPRFRSLLFAQFGSTLAMAGVGGGYGGTSTAISALLGGIVCLLPNAYFIWRSFQFQGAQYAERIVKSFYRAEAGKFGLTAVLFTFIFVAVPPSNPAFFFGAYVATLSTQWLGPWLLRGSSHT